MEEHKSSSNFHLKTFLSGLLLSNFTLWRETHVSCSLQMRTLSNRSHLNRKGKD